MAKAFGGPTALIFNRRQGLSIRPSGLSVPNILVETPLLLAKSPVPAKVDTWLSIGLREVPRCISVREDVAQRAAAKISSSRR